MRTLFTTSAMLIGATILFLAFLYVACKALLSGTVQDFAKDYTSTCEAIKSDFFAARRKAADAKAAKKAK